MPLSINPIAQLVASVSAGISKATNEAQASLPSATDLLSKANLDSKINALSGGIGSGLNGLSGSLKSGLDSVSGLAGSAAGQLSGLGNSLPGATALGGIGNSITSTISGGLNSLQTVAGSTSNITADISGGLNKLTGGNLAGGLQSLAGSISQTAGMLNNILSLRRGANLPSGAEAFLKQGTAIKLSPGAKNDWRVRLTCQWNIFKSPLFSLLENTGGVVWPYMPNITVATKANYTQLDPTHGNYSFQAYKNSVVEDITITGEFSCETETDAAYWIAATTFFKTATKMFFGQGEFAGNPPLVCNLTGYGSSIFDKIPVIVKSFSVDLKDDVNYIRCNTFGTNTWVPVMSTITVTVSPVYNRQRLRKFSLQDYARGKTADPGGVGYL
jgi:hypothetical protein